jgi:hypothetical protein
VACLVNDKPLTTIIIGESFRKAVSTPRVKIVRRQKRHKLGLQYREPERSFPNVGGALQALPHAAF